MARVIENDERGAVYVEFLIAFFPLFLLFLALCQLALVIAAEAVVRHAAFAAVRSAIVVLEDSPDNFDGADRGSLSDGDPRRITSIEQVVSKLGVRTKHSAHRSDKSLITILHSMLPQQGARMVPIRTAAYLPLLPLSPSAAMRDAEQETIAQSLVSTSEEQLGFALDYTKAATLVTVHDAEDTEVPALGPIGHDATVTVKVRYLFHCTVPVVRAIMCRSLARLVNEPLLSFNTSQDLAALVNPNARFKLLTATATLPNQGAAYCSRTE